MRIFQFHEPALYNFRRSVFTCAADCLCRRADGIDQQLHNFLNASMVIGIAGFKIIDIQVFPEILFVRSPLKNMSLSRKMGISSILSRLSCIHLIPRRLNIGPFRPTCNGLFNPTINGPYFPTYSGPFHPTLTTYHYSSKTVPGNMAINNISLLDIM